MNAGSAAGQDLPGVRVRVVNLTPHPVTVYDRNDPVASWPPSGTFARLVESERPVAQVVTDQGPVPVTEISYAGRVADLPGPTPGTVFLVSRILAAAVDRADLYFPAGEVRDGDGGVIGCHSFGRFVPDRTPFAGPGDPPTPPGE